MTDLLPFQIRALLPSECPYCCLDAALGDQLCEHHARLDAEENRERQHEALEDRY